MPQSKGAKPVDIKLTNQYALGSANMSMVFPRSSSPSLAVCLARKHGRIDMALPRKSAYPRRDKQFWTWGLRSRRPSGWRQSFLSRH